MKQLAMALIVSALSFSSANAAVVTLQPDNGKDAEIVNGFYQDSNFGNSSELIANWVGNQRSIGLIEFDLTSVPAGSVTSATLSLMHSGNSNFGSRYDVFRITSAWDEATVTFNTAPTIDPVAVASLVITDNLVGVYRNWDVTETVAGWLSGAYENYGFWIEEVPIQGTATAYFVSSDGSSSSDPKLTIDVASVPEPTALGLLGLSFLGLAAARRRRN